MSRNPPWSDGLSSSAAALRTLLHHVDSASVPLWGGEKSSSLALRTAIYRYVHIFLPMRAAYLYRTSAIAPPSDAASGLAGREGAALRRLAKRRKQLGHAPEGTNGALFDRRDGEDMLAARPIPPVDVAFVWMLHRLAPSKYADDCRAMFGVVVPGDGDEGTPFEHAWIDNVESGEVFRSRLQWSCWASAARRKGLFLGQAGIGHKAKTYWPTYLWPVMMKADGKARMSERLGVSNGAMVTSFWKSRLSYDLCAAAQRQKAFFHNISGEYYDGQGALDRGVERYEKFLGLMKSSPGTFIVPLYDIDLVWHAHICSTSAYKSDCLAIVGRFVDHKEDDNREAGGELESGFATTAKLWKAAYGEEYHDENTGYKGAPNPHRNRVLSLKGASQLKEDRNIRASFVAAVVCKACKNLPLPEMEEECANKLRKVVEKARCSDAQGGACAVLYSSGIAGSMATSCRKGYGNCAGYAGAQGGAGCGYGGGACGAAACGGGCSCGGGGCGGGDGGGGGGGGGDGGGGGGGCGGGGCGGCGGD